MRQYEGEQPQFIHRWVLKDILSQDVKVVRGRKVVEVHDLEAGVEVVFEDGTREMADLVIGKYRINFT
jgi:2-polyprenyl-6-methoxyphenol hydroxylase-like FAD-dependent oxidoreductase